MFPLKTKAFSIRKKWCIKISIDGVVVTKCDLSEVTSKYFLFLFFNFNYVNGNYLFAIALLYFNKLINVFLIKI